MINSIVVSRTQPIKDKQREKHWQRQHKRQGKSRSFAAVLKKMEART